MGGRGFFPGDKAAGAC